MDSLEALRDDVRDIGKDVKGILVTQERHANILDEHIRRTAILEDAVRPLTQREIARAGFARVGAVILGLLTAGAALVEIVYHLKSMGH